MRIFSSHYKVHKMLHNIQDIEIKYFSDLNESEIEAVETFLASDIDEMSDAYDNHRVEHGIAPGAICLSEVGIIGVGGIHYLEETGFYEITCNVMPGQEEHVTPVLNHLVSHAFDNLKMDKVCARAIPGSVFNHNLANSRFTFLGERMFMLEQDEHIWNYYELEDESNLVSAENNSVYIDKEWDALF